ncbi:MAG: CoA ester lyase [Pseudomonadota bacterium]
MLYLPGSNERALEKAVELGCDAIIFDLEDAVAPAMKAASRERVLRALQTRNYGHRECIVRINGLDTPWGDSDLRALANRPPDAVLVPKVESTQQLDDMTALLDTVKLASVPIWYMVETPRAVLKLDVLLEHRPPEVLVMGTSDLVKELRAEHLEDRSNLSFALQRTLLVARAFGLVALDGVQLDFRNGESFERSCRASRQLGFDGRTLIHPSQIATANAAYGVSEAAVAYARRVLAAWEGALADGKGVVELDGQLIENLHADDARRTLALAEAITERG